jgi:hypothetical protein
MDQLSAVSKQVFQDAGRMRWVIGHALSEAESREDFLHLCDVSVWYACRVISTAIEEHAPDVEARAKELVKGAHTDWIIDEWTPERWAEYTPLVRRLASIFLSREVIGTQTTYAEHRRRKRPRSLDVLPRSETRPDQEREIPEAEALLQALKNILTPMEYYIVVEIYLRGCSRQDMVTRLIDQGRYKLGEESKAYSWVVQTLFRALRKARRSLGIYWREAAEDIA